jgi:AcrR family transcriptional regulator
VAHTGAAEPAPDCGDTSGGKRRYLSPRRQMQAEQTRAAVIAAASRVFSERGWIATNVRDIAREAGVSVETLYAGVGTKAELLKVALDVAIVGDDVPVPFAARVEAAAMGAGSTVTARALVAAQVVTAMNVRIYRLDQALRQGAPVEAVLAERLAAGERNRRVDVAEGARRVAGRAMTEVEVDEIGALTSSVVYDLLVRSSGWSNTAYEQWLATRFIELIERNPVPTKPEASHEGAPDGNENSQ